MKRINTYFIPLIVVVIFIASCTSSTRITSDPPNATVIIKGNVVGETPYVYEDSKISFSKTPVTLQMEGYEDFHTVLVKDEEVDVGAIVGGIFFYWPFIWTFGYQPDHHYVLQSTSPKYEDVDLRLSNQDMRRIQELNEMYKEGIIDQEEFELLKKRILKKEE